MDNNKNFSWNNAGRPASTSISEPYFRGSYSDINANRNYPQQNTLSSQRFRDISKGARTVSTQYAKSDFQTSDKSVEIITDSQLTQSTTSKTQAGSNVLNAKSCSEEIINPTNRNLFVSPYKKSKSSSKGSIEDSSKINLTKNSQNVFKKISTKAVGDDNVSVDVSSLLSESESYRDLDLSFVEIACQTDVQLFNRRSLFLETKEFGCQTDWWLSPIIDVDPTSLTYNVDSAYIVLDESPIVTRYTGPEVIKLQEVLSTIHSRKLMNCLRWYLMALGFLLIGSGVVMLLAVFRTMSTTKYLDHYLRHSVRTLICIIVLGIFHPILAGIYCLHTVHHLQVLRPYYLRTTMFLILPLSLFLISIVIYFEIQASFKSDFQEWMRVYQSSSLAQAMWDSIQSEFQCCGLYNRNEWIILDNIVNYPKSCCHENQNQQITVSSCAGEFDFWNNGCMEKLKNVHFKAIMCFTFTSLFQFAAEALSVCLMRSFNARIKDKFVHPPSAKNILLGPLASLFESKKENHIDPRTLIRFPINESESETESETECSETTTATAANYKPEKKLEIFYSNSNS